MVHYVVVGFWSFCLARETRPEDAREKCAVALDDARKHDDDQASAALWTAVVESSEDAILTISPVRDRDGRVVGGAAIARDISDLKAREAALMRSELRYRTLTSQLPDAAVYEYDRDLRIISAQGSLLKKLGSPPEALAGRGLLELAADGGANYRAALRGEARRFEAESADAILDVDVVPLVNGAGETTGALALARDVSARRRVERNLHFQAELLDRIDVAVVATNLEGRVTHWNRQAESYFGRPRAEALGRPIVEATGARGLPDPVEVPNALSASKTWQGELTIVRADGTELPVLTTRSTVCDLAGDVIGYVDVSLDLTVTRAEQEDRSALMRQLHQSQKLDGIGRLAGGIAHDFNNLLTIVINYADLLETELPVDEVAQVITPVPMDVNVALADIITLLRPTIGEHISLRTDPAGDLWSVCMNHSQIEQVLLNLALNARDAMPDGGLLSITTRNLEPDQILIIVADTGSGMTADVAERAFEPFFTTKPWGAGSGLGLATVYGIVKEMRGQVTIESAPGNGTVIRITLPASRERATEPSVLMAKASPRGHGERILVVEDEVGVREIAVRLLTAAGYEVLAAESPEQAVAQARQHPPALLLTDHGIREGRLSFLEKPFTRQTLLERVRKALDSVKGSEAA